jgi:hypothetical protein
MRAWLRSLHEEETMHNIAVRTAIMRAIVAALGTTALGNVEIRNVGIGAAAAADIPPPQAQIYPYPQPQVQPPPPDYYPGPPAAGGYAYPPPVAYAYPPPPPVYYEYAPPPVVIAPRPFYLGRRYAPFYGERPYGPWDRGPYVARGYGRYEHEWGRGYRGW